MLVYAGQSINSYKLFIITLITIISKIITLITIISKIKRNGKKKK